MNAVGAKATFAGIPRSHTIKVLDTDLVSIGLFEPPDGSYRLVEEETNGCYSRFVFRDSHMQGCLLLGNGEAGAAASRAIEQGRDFSSLLAGACRVSDVVAELKNEKIQS
jgi:nitrite reductase (NADH) large subunit